MSPPPGAFLTTPPPAHLALRLLQVSPQCSAVPPGVFLSVISLTYWDASSVRAGTWVSVLPVPGARQVLRLYLFHEPACPPHFIISSGLIIIQADVIVPAFPMRKLRSRAFMVSRPGPDPGSVMLRPVFFLHALLGKSHRRPEISAVPAAAFQGTAWLVRPHPVREELGRPLAGGTTLSPAPTSISIA